MEATRKAPALPGWIAPVALGLLAAGFLGALPVSGPVIQALGALHSGLYHHEGESHSFVLGGQQSVLCARNTGIYVGALLAVLGIGVSGRGSATGAPPLRVGVVLALFVGVMAADGFNSLADDLGYPTPYEPSTALRLGTGLLAGIAVGAYFLPVLNGLLWRDADPRRVLPDLRALPPLLAAPAALWLVVMLGIDALALPVALLTATASLLLFGGVNLLFLVLLLRLDNRYGRARELLPPAAAAASVAAVQLALLAWAVNSFVVIPA